MSESVSDRVSPPAGKSSEISDTPSRLRAYKNKALDSEELRRRREEAGVQLRKQRREEQLFKRRNVQLRGEKVSDSGAGAECGDVGDEEVVNILGDSAVSSSSVNVGITPRLIEELNSSVSHDILNAVQRIRKMLSREPDPPIDEVVAAGLVPRLVELLGSSNGRLQFEAAWAVTNVASGNGLHTRAVVEANAVQVLVNLLTPRDLSAPLGIALSHYDVQEQAVWALGNIAGDSPTFRNYVLSCGALPPLLNILAKGIPSVTGTHSSPVQSHSSADSTTEEQQCKGKSSSEDTPCRPHPLVPGLSLVRNGIWCLSNLCRGKNPPPDFKQVSTALPVLAQLLFSVDHEILADTCWTLSYLADGPDDHVQAVIDAGVARRLVELILHPAPLVQAAALRALGNLLTGDDIQTQIVLNCQALPFLAAVLQNCTREAVRKEVCWALSNVTAGNRTQIQAVIDANLFPLVVEVMLKAEFKTRKEAAWVVTNATAGGTAEQVRYLASTGCVAPLCELLTVADTRLVHVALTGLDNILRLGELEARQLGEPNKYALMVEECLGLDKIEFLQTHENQDIYQKAYDLIEKYFAGVDEDCSVVPSPGVVHLSGISGTPTTTAQYQFEVNQPPAAGFSF